MQAAGLQRWARLLASAEFSRLHAEGGQQSYKICTTLERSVIPVNFVTLVPAPAQGTAPFSLASPGEKDRSSVWRQPS